MSTTAIATIEQVLNMLLMMLSTLGWVSHDQSTALLGDVHVILPALGNALMIVWVIYSRYGTVRVSGAVAKEAVRTLEADRRQTPLGMVLAFGLVLGTLATHDAKAGDLAPLPRARAFALPVAQCDVTACTGFYLGAGLSGIASNVDVIGNGVLNSLAAGGGMFDAHAGGLYYNGKYLVGAEFGVGLETSRGAAQQTLGGNRVNGYEMIMLGGALGNLIGAPTLPPPSGLNLQNVIASSIPFVQLGMWQRGGNTQQVSGAGVMLPLTSGWFVKSSYVYGTPMDGLPAFNMISFGINRLF